MTTLSANLIPRVRREAQAVAARARRWAGVLAGAAALLGIAWAALLNTYGADAGSAAAQLERADADLRDADAELKRSQADLAAAERMLSAASEVRDHPDWSALLGAIAALKGEDVVLASLDIGPQDARAGSATTARPSRYSMRVTGVAKDHRAATAFSLMLERTGVFARVTLTDTSTQARESREVVAFGVECVLDEGAGVSQ